MLATLATQKYVNLRRISHALPIYLTRAYRSGLVICILNSVPLGGDDVYTDRVTFNGCLACTSHLYLSNIESVMWTL